MTSCTRPMAFSVLRAVGRRFEPDLGRICRKRQCRELSDEDSADKKALSARRFVPEMAYVMNIFHLPWASLQLKINPLAAGSREKRAETSVLDVSQQHKVGLVGS